MLSADTKPGAPPGQAELDTPPQEGNCRVQTRYNHPDSLVYLELDHPSTGGELLSADTKPPPRQAELDTPPQEGNCRVQTRCGCSSVSVLVISPPQEGNCSVQIRSHHPVKRSLTPLHRRGIASADTKIPPRQAELDTPPQEGNCSVQIRCSNHPVGLRPPPLHRRGIAQCRYGTTTPSSGA